MNNCLDLSINIISLGEFDYPPAVTGPEGSDFEESFNKSIQKAKDSYNHPVFLVMGSRHDYDESTKTCANQARIFAKNLLENLDKRPPTDDRPILHEKLVSATKAGERISRQKVSNLKFYSTKFGHLGVLICVGAYNSTVLFSLRNSKLSNQLQSLDIILVPAYNYNDKLYYACQTLSLLCGCYVVLIDACSRSSRADVPKPQLTELFAAGRSFRSLDQTNPDVGEHLDIGSDLISAWEISMDFLNSVRRSNQSDANPFFISVKNYVSQTSLTS